MGAATKPLQIHRPMLPGVVGNPPRGHRLVPPGADRAPASAPVDVALQTRQHVLQHHQQVRSQPVHQTLVRAGHALQQLGPATRGSAGWGRGGATVVLQRPRVPRRPGAGKVPIATMVPEPMVRKREGGWAVCTHRLMDGVAPRAHRAGVRTRPLLYRGTMGRGGRRVTEAREGGDSHLQHLTFTGALLLKLRFGMRARRALCSAASSALALHALECWDKAAAAAVIPHAPSYSRGMQLCDTVAISALPCTHVERRAWQGQQSDPHRGHRCACGAQAACMCLVKGHERVPHLSFGQMLGPYGFGDQISCSKANPAFHSGAHPTAARHAGLASWQNIHQQRGPMQATQQHTRQLRGCSPAAHINKREQPVLTCRR